MLRVVGATLQRLAGWSEGCPCHHGVQRVKGEGHQRAANFRKVLGANNCPLAGSLGHGARRLVAGGHGSKAPAGQVGVLDAGVLACPAARSPVPAAEARIVATAAVGVVWHQPRRRGRCPWVRGSGAWPLAQRANRDSQAQGGARAVLPGHGEGPTDGRGRPAIAGPALLGEICSPLPLRASGGAR
eukprot:8163932-Lingulodinium_polyedra.AAC.1